MTSERWRQIEDLYHAALERVPEERPEFLGNACPNDEELRREVESLLAQESPGRILSQSLGSIAAAVLSPEERFASGSTVGPYRILEPLGVGGMGEVYRATDTRLRRDVALKVLPADQLIDPERRARFMKEARAASALNHPNIITIHDIVTENGCDFIVMEYVQGETLAKKITHKELRLPQTLKYAAQIADALARAHAAGIVHRDLKPSNIMVAADGTVKVLDFGVAKLRAVRAVDETTATAGKTGAGVVLGTAGYMSPEQVRGGEVDHRSDIFSFGVVLHEMLCGRRAFQGQSTIEVMNAILNEAPPELPDTVPPALRQIVGDCLEKDPAARFESARDLAFALRVFWPGSGIGTAVPDLDTARGASRGRWLVLALAAAVIALSVPAALYLTRPEPVDLSAYKFKPFATEAEPERSSSWSPDGKSVAYLKRVDGQLQVMVRSLDAASPTQLTRLPSGAYETVPFFARDGERVYFIASGALWSVAAVGGEPREVLRAPMQAAALSPNGKTLAFWQPYEEAGKRYSGVWISSPPGAPPRKYTPAPFRVEGQYIPDYLRFSPDGSQIGFAGFRVSGEARLWILPWPDGPEVRPRQVFSGYSFRSPTAFDWMPDSRWMCLAADRNLWLGDSRTGELQQLTALATGTATMPSVSPGGERVLFTAGMSDYDMVELPLDGSPPKPLLATARSEISPSWSAAGDLLAFITDRSGESEIWVRSPSGNWERPAVRQSDFPKDTEQDFRSVALSPDGILLAYSRHGRLWVSPTSGGRASHAVVGGEREVGVASWSPDSSSIAYRGVSDGKDYTAVTRIGSQQSPFLIPGTVSQCLSPPVWSPDGLWIACGGYDRTVLLVSPDGERRRSLPSPVPAESQRFVLVWSRNAETLYVASSLTPEARLDAIDVRSGRSRQVAEYPRQAGFGTPSTYSVSGSLSRDGKGIATTVLNIRADLWMLEGSPRPRRHWFRRE